MVSELTRQQATTTYAWAEVRLHTSEPRHHMEMKCRFQVPIALPHEYSSRYPPNRNSGEPQSQSGRCGKQQVPSRTGNRPTICWLSAHSLHASHSSIIQAPSPANWLLLPAPLLGCRRFTELLEYAERHCSWAICAEAAASQPYRKVRSARCQLFAID